MLYCVVVELPLCAVTLCCDVVLRYVMSCRGVQSYPVLCRFVMCCFKLHDVKYCVVLCCVVLCCVTLCCVVLCCVVLCCVALHCVISCSYVKSSPITCGPTLPAVVVQDVSTQTGAFEASLHVVARLTAHPRNFAFINI